MKTRGFSTRLGNELANPERVTHVKLCPGLQRAAGLVLAGTTPLSHF
jgi:hypothetical protein